MYRPKVIKRVIIYNYILYCQFSEQHIFNLKIKRQKKYEMIIDEKIQFSLDKQKTIKIRKLQKSIFLRHNQIKLKKLCRKQNIARL